MRLRFQPRWKVSRRGWLEGVALVVVFTLAVLWTFLSIPTSNTAQDRFDVILVLGSPTEMHGELSNEQQWRVDEGVREFRAGRAPRMIFSGAAVAYRYVEADAMAAYARRSGVPAEAILTETRARNTIQNIGYSVVVMRAHGWTSLEVISSGDHLPRAALILANLNRGGSPLRWRVHPSPTPGRNWFDRVLYDSEEAVTTALLRWFGLRLAPVLHGVAVVQRTLGFAVRWVWYHLTGQVQKLG